jgi:hypothetical protein
MEEVGVWFDVVRKSQVVMLAGCEAASPKPDFSATPDYRARKADTGEATRINIYI